MSDANRTNLAFRREAAFGEFEAGNPVFFDVRYTGESLHQEIDSVISQEIRADRQIVDFLRTGLRAAGDMNWEMSYGAHDDLLEAALLSTPWGAEDTVISASANVTFTAPDTVTLTIGAWTTTPTAGEWIEIVDSQANSGKARVVSATTTTITIAGQTLVTQSGGTVSIFQLASITAGTTFITYNAEKEHEDLATVFQQFAGLAIDRKTLSVTADGIITGSFGFLGRKQQNAAASLGSGANTAAAANGVMTGVDDVALTLEGLAAYDITAFTLELRNNLRARLQVGTLGAISIGTGTINLTGTLNAYFEDVARLDKYLNFTESGIAQVLQDVDGNGYIFDIPAVKYSLGQANVGGINQDVLTELTWQAFRHSTLGYTYKIARFAA